MLPAIHLLHFCMKKAWLEGDHTQDLSSDCFLCPRGMLGSARALVWNVGPIFLEDQSWSLKKTKDMYIQIQIVWGTLEVYGQANWTVMSIVPAKLTCPPEMFCYYFYTIQRLVYVQRNGVSCPFYYQEKDPFIFMFLCMYLYKLGKPFCPLWNFCLGSVD